MKEKIKARLWVIKFCLKVIYPKFNSMLFLAFLAVKYRKLKHKEFLNGRSMDTYKLKTLSSHVQRLFVKDWLDDNISVNLHKCLVISRNRFIDLASDNLFYLDNGLLWVTLKLSSNKSKILKHKKNKEEKDRLLKRHLKSVTAEVHKKLWSGNTSFSLDKLRVVPIVGSKYVPDDTIFTTENESQNITTYFGMKSSKDVEVSFHPVPAFEQAPKIAEKAEVCVIVNEYDFSNDFLKEVLSNHFEIPKLAHLNDIFSVNLTLETTSKYHYKYSDLVDTVGKIHFKCIKLDNNMSDKETNSAAYGNVDTPLFYGNVDTPLFIVKGVTQLSLGEGIHELKPKDEYFTMSDVDCKSAHLLSSCPTGLKHKFDLMQESIAPFLSGDLNDLTSSLSSPIIPMLLLTGAAGSGRHLLVKTLAKFNGMNCLPIDCNAMQSSTARQTESKIAATIQKAKAASPVIMLLDNFEVFAVDPENNEDCRVVEYFVNSLTELFHHYTKHPIIFVAVTERSDLKPNILRMFLDKFHIPKLNAQQRLEMLQWFVSVMQLDLESRDKEDRPLQMDTSNLTKTTIEILQRVAAKTETFIYGDMATLIHFALREAYLETHSRCKSLPDSSMHHLREEHFNTALESMRSLQSQHLDAPNIPKVYWEDIGGLDKLKKELLKTIELPIKYPHLFKNSSLKRSGILLYGPPGCGKTLVAKAVSTELNVSFLSVKGPELLNMYIGQSEENVRRVFETARASSPCIVFLDELDAMAARRGAAGDSGGASDRLVSQLLAELDGVTTQQDADSSSFVFVMGATNRPDLLEPSLLRPGRLDKLVYVAPYCGLREKTRVLTALCRGHKLRPEVNLSDVAATLPDRCTGADLLQVVATARSAAVRALVDKLQNGAIRESELSPDSVVIGVSEMVAGVSSFRPSVTDEELAHYEALQLQMELKSDKDNVSVVTVVDDNTVTVTNIKVNASGAGDSRERVRSYHADYTFDSSGSPADERYASQDQVFSSLGRDVLSCISGGVSACVLAYGQSATGKTHTMMGGESDPGLVPRLCAALYEQQAHCAVTVSFLEIYNEKVHDLLAGEGPPAECRSLPRRRGNARKDLRVREHPTRGPYVQNLRRVAVSDVQALLALVSEGARRRRTAPTKRNPCSSRSHALLEISTHTATLHLADLAGSEKASWEGCSSGPGRQKEGANINKSLVALSNVISALVSGCGRGRFVPYRDSALTWLLKDCFTGGARAFIVATVSPSAACYGESASTLRWAARARLLPEPPAPRTQLQQTRAALQAQLTSLLAELDRHHIRYIPETGQISYDDSHWMLQKNQKLNQDVTAMDTTAQPADNQNSESTASSVASGSSDIINTVGKQCNLTSVVTKEMDKLFGPSLERARSGSDLKVAAPFRVKRRQYRSQEVLPVEKTVHPTITTVPIDIQQQSSADVSSDPNKAQNHPPVPIYYDNNQRAEIVASVTERLYSKLKKKEESAVAKMESVMDKKIMEPLSELRICTNARQRLVELSQKALRNKRRIGIPAHTQTRKQVIRVKDQEINIQNDLQPYFIKERGSFIPHQDVGTETAMVTPRCKEIAVGPKCGSATYNDTSTITEIKRAQLKHSCVMTDVLLKSDRCTQTIMVPPPRRKKRASTFTKYIKSDNNRKNRVECSGAPVISINISQAYAADSESPSDDGQRNDIKSSKHNVVPITPDLLTNHNPIEINVNGIEVPHLSNTTEHIIEEQQQAPRVIEPELQSLNDVRINNNDEFPDEDCSLPRVRLNSLPTSSPKEMENIILGRNHEIYPYNIVMSPPREREKESLKRSVKFKDLDVASSPVASPSNSWNYENRTKRDLGLNPPMSEKDVHCCKSETSNHTSSDSTDSSKGGSGYFMWKRSPTNRWSKNHGSTTHTPVYKDNHTLHRRTSKTEMYREFLGLDKVPSTDDDVLYKSYCSGSEDETSQTNFQTKRQFFEKKFERAFSFDYLERNILKSCNQLEISVNKYDKYLANQRQNFNLTSSRTPREYLQHLVDIRKQMVKGDSDTSTDSSHRFF